MKIKENKTIITIKSNYWKVMSGISWLHELSTLHSLEDKIRTCIQNIALWNQPICVVKTNFFIKHFTPTKTKWFFKIHTCIGFISEIHCTTRTKKNMHVFFYVSPVTCNLFNLSSICIWSWKLQNSKFYWSNKEFKFFFLSFLKIQKKNKNE